jgi:hypothetical protein
MPKNRRKRKPPKRSLALPDLEQTKSAVLNTLTSKSGQQTYHHAINEFVDWYCSEPRLAFNRTVILRYRIHFGTTTPRSNNDKPKVGCGQARRVRGLRLRIAQSGTCRGHSPRQRRAPDSACAWATGSLLSRAVRCCCSLRATV